MTVPPLPVGKAVVVIVGDGIVVGGQTIDIVMPLGAGDGVVAAAGVVDAAAGVVEAAAGVVDVAAGVVDVAAGVVDVAAGVVDVAAGVVEVAAGVVDEAVGALVVGADVTPGEPVAPGFKTLGGPL